MKRLSEGSGRAPNGDGPFLVPFPTSTTKQLGGYCRDPPRSNSVTDNLNGYEIWAIRIPINGDWATFVDDLGLQSNAVRLLLAFVAMY